MMPSEHSGISLRDTAPPPSLGAVGELEALRRSFETLHRRFQLSVAALILLLAALNVYLLNQVRTVHRRAAVLAQQITEMRQAVANYEAKSVPWMDKFSGQLEGFAKTHPDFAQVLDRYRRPGETNQAQRAKAGGAARR